MPKNRAKQANNRAKKAKERSRDRQMERARKAVEFKAKKDTSLAHFIESPTTGYEFWFLHGTNFILSSIETGVWDPIFPEIYKGKPVSRTEVFKRVMDKHFDSEKGELSDLGTKAILWSSLKPKEMFALVVRARMYAWAHKSDPKQEASPWVWSFLDKVMTAFIGSLNSNSLSPDGKFQISSEKYGEFLPQAIADTVSALSGVKGTSEPEP